MPAITRSSTFHLPIRVLDVHVRYDIYRLRVYDAISAEEE